MPLTLARPEPRHSANFIAGQWQPAGGAMTCASKEAFGPVAPLTHFTDEAEVIAAANSAEAAPFGGVKESGCGREGSTHGLDDYLHTKYLARDCSTERPLASGQRTGPGDQPEMPLKKFSTI